MEPTVTEVAPQPAPAVRAPRIRTWPALVMLAALSPLVGEIISGSTPPLLAIQPFAVIFLPTLYGIWAVLIHEILARRRLGWGNALLLGAAFGIFQEALVVQTWFNFISPQSPSYIKGVYGVLWGTRWDWALNLTFYHAVVSITIPMIWMSLLVPRRYPLPLLGPKAIVALTLWMLALCGLLAYGVAFTQFAADGYTGPPLESYLVACALTLAALLFGAFVRFPTPRARGSKLAPGLWKVRLGCCAFMLAFFAATAVLPAAAHLPLAGELAISAGLFGAALWRVATWSARPGWGKRHWLAVITGVVLYFALIWAPLVEFGAHLPARTGLTAFDLAVAVGLLIWDRRLRRRESVGVVEEIPNVSVDAEPVAPRDTISV